MVKYFILGICFIGIFYSCSPNRKLLKNHDYAAVIRNSIERLNRDSKDSKATKTLTQTYTQAIGYYQNEIDQILTSNDQFKWKRTLDIMFKNNEMSEEILYNSSALRLVCEPKIYSSEIPDVKQKAVAELYEAGISLLKKPSRKNAKEAYDYFKAVAHLESGYKDVGRNIQESKELATIKIVVEQVAAYSQNKNLFSKRFYQTMLNNLQANFLYDNFVILYTPEEAKRRKIETPDMIVLIAFIDFQVGQTENFFGSEQIHTNGVIEMKVFSALENKDILNSRFPGQYIWQNYNSNKGADLQELFDSFSLSMCDQVVDRLSLFIKQYN